MKFMKLFKNLNLFFNFYPIKSEVKQNILSLLYDCFSDSEKKEYLQEIELLQKIHSVQINLIDFFKLQKQLDKMRENENL